MAKNKSFTKYKYNTISGDKGKRHALIVKTGRYPQYDTIHTIYSPNGKAIYEIKKVDSNKIKFTHISDTTFELIGEIRGINDGLKGSYFNSRNFNKFVTSRIDDTINFNWKRSSPFQGVNKDNFSMRWEGFIKIDENDEYTFYTKSDDGVRLRSTEKQLLKTGQHTAPEKIISK